MEAQLPEKVHLEVHEIEITGLSRSYLTKAPAKLRAEQAPAEWQDAQCLRSSSTGEAQSSSAGLSGGSISSGCSGAGDAGSPLGGGWGPQFELAAAEAFLRDEAKLAGKWVHAFEALQQPHTQMLWVLRYRLCSPRSSVSLSTA